MATAAAPPNHADAFAESCPERPEDWRIDEPLLLRFVEAHGVGLQPVYGDEDPLPSECAEQFLLEATQEGKRRRLDGLEGDGQGEDERMQVVQDCHRTALEQLHRATTVAELLHRTTWGHNDQERACFLQLHPAVRDREGVPHQEDLHELVQERIAAMAVWPAEFREAGAAISLATRHAELEETLHFLRQHWLIHCVGRRYAVELWRSDEVQQSNVATPKLAGKHLAFIAQHHQLGPCLSFPAEIAQLVEWQYRLSVTILPLRFMDSGTVTVGSQQQRQQQQHARLAFPEDPKLSRGQAMHAVLLDAQEVLVDHCLFRRFRECVTGGSTSMQRLRWHLLHASSTEVSLLAPARYETEPIHLKLTYSASAVTSNAEGAHFTRSSMGNRLWDWFSEVATLRLREMFILGAEAYLPALASKLDKKPCMPDIFHSYTLWIESQLDALIQYSNTRQGAICEANHESLSEKTLART